jgi:hypothetical protein
MQLPDHALQVDPFGHSATQASLLSGLLGFDSLFFGRADYQVQDTALRRGLGLWWHTCTCLREACVSILILACPEL